MPLIDKYLSRRLTPEPVIAEVSNPIDGPSVVQFPPPAVDPSPSALSILALAKLRIEELREEIKRLEAAKRELSLLERMVEAGKENK